MDKMVYIAASGAKQSLMGLALKANNLANANTTGFKADFAQARSMQAFGEGLPSRVFSMEERPGSNMTSGGIQQTGRELDIAMSDNAWLSVQDASGNEAYTKVGTLNITAEGMLVTSGGRQVIGEGGPIILPVPIEKIEFSKDGAIQVRPQGAPANFLEEVDRLKVVEANNSTLEKGNDGLFRPKPNQTVETSANVQVISGALEMSNVNPVHEMVDMISHQRQFELQVKLMKTAEEIDQSQDQLLRIV
ncbi:MULTISPECIES: flagellar basal body rod protein FlgF [Pseudoalteromonas]|uniref:Flagellar basal-body rod protein FlgF n=3 Tax=Pseudoalteromonas TaxID=53246 RepID=Q3IDW3_PSET1|nr:MULTISPECIES: flagellar basal body rod protein FlgF [Pseudoalteromonas]ALS32181.1 flagellar basal-body rod protein FlgF [Pseudoalteromonas translucida KMM 520]ASM53175.1 flagellar basal-body rod protein FlgF [Pseudoalteromonas nigrifaciens]MBB1369699.1 flagellar basal body rod protein FlgF [Pseudoalteromonas sp. SR45-4]MBB1407363.1 flagellar basal body rod protein FlgF [Pseudoalteromonas sp. SG44-5]MBE0419695.1 flagellar basal body rod protein FlgF [Pseudoalteromonas nigrifaciens]|tara:strand:+ start:236 stop:979 length:744 start_codon:yes stop_codon:yes gene_type:complete